MNNKYEAVIIEIGDVAEEFIQQKMLILFNESAPLELKEISVIHSGGILQEEIKVGDFFFLGDKKYKVTAIGEVANKNFKNLGHVCLVFDGKNIASLPGNIHLDGEILKMPEIGEKIKIYSE